MLRIIKFEQNEYNLPINYTVDSDGYFESGMFGQLYINNGKEVCGVSNGKNPIGIIDDFRTNTITTNSIEEVVITRAFDVKEVDGKLVLNHDLKQELKNHSILPSSFYTFPVDVCLIPINGVVIFTAGTELNFDMDNDGILDSIRTIVSYTCYIGNSQHRKWFDSTEGSGQITIWTKGVFETDIFDPSPEYSVGSKLYVSEYGRITTKNNDNNPSIGAVIKVPSKDFFRIQFELNIEND